MKNIENMDEKKISALRVVVLGLVFLPLAIVGAMPKKRMTYRVIQYNDGKDPGCDIVVIMEKTTVAATGHRDLVSAMKTGAGSTAKGQNWQDYIDGNGIMRGVYLDIDTSAAGFSDTPAYVSAIGGDAWHYATTGGSAIYNPTATTFRVYVRWSSNDVGPNPPNPPDSVLAKKYNWYISWIGWQQ